MKKIIGLALCVIILFTATLPVLADGDAQAYALIQSSADKLDIVIQNEPTVWESPSVQAGDTTIDSSMFALTNYTETTQTLTLRTVVFPYENEAALVYLNHLHITVQDGEKVLYDGVYSRINDKNGLSLSVTLEPNEEYILFIDLYCDYAYTGAGWNDEPITWEFDIEQPTEQDHAQDNTATTITKADSTPAKFSDPALTEILIACGIAVALLGGVFAYDYWLKKQR